MKKSQQSTNKRRSRTERDKSVTIRLEDRDYSILQALYDARILTKSQLAALFWNDSKSPKAAEKRLRKLYDAEWLDRIHRQTVEGSLEEIYVLGKEGVARLASKTEMTKEEINAVRLAAKNRGLLHMEHLVQINQFRIALILSSKAHGYKILDWKREGDFTNKKGEFGRGKAYQVVDPKTREPIPFTPDGFASLELADGRITHFFLEVDNNSHDNKGIVKKLKSYLIFLMNKDHERLLDIKGFRLLVLAKSVSRRIKIIDEVAEWLKKYYNRDKQWMKLFLFLSMEDLSPEDDFRPVDIFTPIWTVPYENELQTLP